MKNKLLIVSITHIEYMQGSYKVELADFQDFPGLFRLNFQDFSRTVFRTLNMCNYYIDTYDIIKAPFITTSVMHYILSNEKEVNSFAYES